MKKSIIAIAVSTAALASVPTFAAEGSTADVYGNIQYAYSNDNATGKGSNFEDNGSTIGLKGETTVSDSLTAFFKYEVEIEADQKANGPDSGKVNLDQAYVGLKGDFGKVQVGSFDTIYNNAIQDGINQFEYLSPTKAANTSEGDTIAYFSPSMNGFEVQVAAQVKGDNSELAAAKQDGTAAMAVVKYSTGMVSVALGHDTRDNTAASDAKATTGLSVTVAPLENLSVIAKYETTEDTKDIIGLAARYGYGAGDVYASYQNVDEDTAGADKFNEVAAGVTYNLASNVYVFGEVGSFGNSANSDTDTKSAVGVYYGF
ncbi:porin [Marinomonas sp. CT5]|uniref:porin n=1 Tax=Marinomonas sp. CT5 TaxID=2066133 RepID=UPI001820180B|nr:porin [Marinomonas sp. CT5]NVK72465.1 porin [Oceanospirillaceae bacterium]QUX97026.1 porin [Marinomonas sp. CT5]